MEHQDELGRYMSRTVHQLITLQVQDTVGLSIMASKELQVHELARRSKRRDPDGDSAFSVRAKTGCPLRMDSRLKYKQVLPSV